MTENTPRDTGVHLLNSFVRSFMARHGVKTYRFQMHIITDAKSPYLDKTLFLVWQDDYHERVEGTDCMAVLEEFLRRVKWKGQHNA